ncbi:MAG: putative glycoside hydrolase [Patescibacteria group bacterium]
MGAGILGAFLVFPAHLFSEFLDGAGSAFVGLGNSKPAAPEGKTVEERIADARERSAKIKGLYMTADVASDPGAGAARLRKEIIRIAEETEVNGIVIDVKEVCGVDYDEKRIRQLIGELKQNNIWSIARLTVFKDASQVEAHPEWYLTRASPRAAGGECSRKRHLIAKSPKSEVRSPTSAFWQDRRGGYWMDPASEDVWRYTADIAKRMIDLGFDELQFDYIRFPSDGDVENARYPAWNGNTPRHAALKKFFTFLHEDLKRYKPEIILSADLFGYVALQREDLTIGQRLDDIGHVFDYVSFMVYPSHYYNGLYVPADASRGTDAVYYTVAGARAHPDVVVDTSLAFARDFLDGKTASSTSITASSTATVSAAAATTAEPRARLRPWLEDFFHEEDRAAGRPWGARKVRMQIDAAESVEDHGWLLWNAANVYSEEALKKEP